MTPKSWNPFARKTQPEPTLSAAAGVETDSTDPLILSTRIEEDSAILREQSGLRLERVEIRGEGGALADSFMRASVLEPGLLSDSLRELWLNLPEAATGFRDLLVSDEAALCAALDLPGSSLDQLAPAIANDEIYVRPYDILRMLGQTAALLAAVKQRSGLVLAAPGAQEIAVTAQPLSSAPSLQQGAQIWRAGLLAWDKLADENESDHAPGLIELFLPALEALKLRSEAAGLTFAANAVTAQIARLKQLAAQQPGYLEIAAAALDLPASLQVSGATDTGRRRQHNEDAWLSWQLEQHSSVGASLQVAAIADGMGGHASGEVASSLALDLLRTQLSQSLLPPRTRQGDAAQLGQALRSIIPGISRVLLDRSDMEPQLAGMGTTLVGCAYLRLHSTVPGEAPAADEAGTLRLFSSQPQAMASSCVFWCGDSRAYLLGPCGLTRLSADHSYVQELVDSGQVDPESAFTHPQKNVITRCLGGGNHNSEPELLGVTPGPGELLLLCSDGLSDALRDSEMWELARTALAAGATTPELIQVLIDGANAAGGPDNITVLVVQGYSMSAPIASAAKPGPWA